MLYAIALALNQSIMKQLFFFLVLVFCYIKACSQAKPFSYGGEKRRFTIYLPTSYEQQPGKHFPLVLNFHGGGMTMTEHMFYSRMNATAEKHHFIVVYPQGVKQDWNVGFETSYQNGTDDVGFVNALLEYLFKEYRVKKEMVYASGLSRGGFLCHRLAAELPHRFAAIASVGGLLPDSVAFFHKEAKQMSVLQIHGDRDQVVSYAGKGGAYQSALATYDYWKKINGLQLALEKSKVIDRQSKDSTAIVIKEASGNGFRVSLVTVKGGGHTWPGSDPFNIGFSLGRTTKEIDANEIIWLFFSAHTRK
jgi:polyhydroxybutyrate depolymerase